MNSCPYKPRKILTEKQAIKKEIGSFYHPSEKRYRTGACPIGSELRKGYYRKAYTKKDGTYVFSTYVDPVCIKEKGMPGKIISKYKLPPLGKDDDLKPFGYKTIISADERFKALLKAAEKLSYKTVVLRLSLLRTLTKKSNTIHSHIYDEDILNLQRWRKENPDLYKKIRKQK